MTNGQEAPTDDVAREPGRLYFTDEEGWGWARAVISAHRRGDSAAALAGLLIHGVLEKVAYLETTEGEQLELAEV